MIFHLSGGGRTHLLVFVERGLIHPVPCEKRLSPQLFPVFVPSLSGKIIIFIEFVLAKWLPQRRFFAPVKLMLHDASLPLLSGQVNCPGGPVVLALQNLGLQPIRKRVSVLSAFPMFVPSLSWQNDHF
jgi:hypothetical protein